MSEFGIVFLASTAASFLPLYWLMTRAWSKTKSKAAPPQPKLGRTPAAREFMGTLRRETISRVDAALAKIASEASEAARDGVTTRLPAATQMRLDDVGQLVASLFPGEATEIYAARTQALARPGAATVIAIQSARRDIVDAMERAITQTATPPAAAAAGTSAAKKRMMRPAPQLAPASPDLADSPAAA